MKCEGGNGIYGLLHRKYYCSVTKMHNTKDIQNVPTLENILALVLGLAPVLVLDLALWLVPE